MVEAPKPPWYKRWYGIAFLTVVGMVVGVAALSSVFPEEFEEAAPVVSSTTLAPTTTEATTTTVAPTTTQPPTTTSSPPTTQAPAPVTGERLPGSNFTYNEWEFLTFSAINTPESSEMCDFFEYMWLDEMVEPFREGYNQDALAGEPLMNEVDGIVAVGFILVSHCDYHMEAYFQELEDRYPPSVTNQALDLIDAITAEGQ